MKLSELIAIAKAYRELRTEATVKIDRAVNGENDDSSPDGAQLAVAWLWQVESCSGNDEELGDEVGGAVVFLRRKFRQSGDGDDSAQ